MTDSEIRGSVMGRAPHPLDRALPRAAYFLPDTSITADVERARPRLLHDGASQWARARAYIFGPLNKYPLISVYISHAICSSRIIDKLPR